jgi:MFS family permease
MTQEVRAPAFSLAAYGSLLRENRDFRLLWMAQVVSEIGTWLYAVAIYSLLLELTGQARSVGFAVVLQLLPQVFIAPTAGVLNDRLRRRSVMIFADVCRVFIVLGMLLVRTAEMVWLIWILLLLETFMWALFEPGRSAVIPSVTRNERELIAANALSSMTWSFNLAVGAGIGGLIAYRFGREATFVLNALSFVLSAGLLSMMRLRETHHQHLPPFRARDLVDFAPMLEGVRYVAGDMRMFATMCVKAGIGLLGAHWVILPIFGERVFPVGAPASHGATGGTLAMSLLFGARGVGALAGSLACGFLTQDCERRMRAGIFGGFLMVSISYMALSGAPSLLLACLAVVAGHAGSSMAWVYSTTMLQNMTGDRFRGRVFAADFAGLFLMMSAVSYAAAGLVDWGASIRAIAFYTGLLGLVPAIFWLAAQRLWRGAPART